MATLSKQTRVRQHTFPTCTNTQFTDKSVRKRRISDRIGYNSEKWFNNSLYAQHTATEHGDSAVKHLKRGVNTDDLLAYLEENTLPGQTINVTVIRNNETLTFPVVLGV